MDSTRSVPISGQRDSKPKSRQKKKNTYIIHGCNKQHPPLDKYKKEMKTKLGEHDKMTGFYMILQKDNKLKNKRPT